MVDQPLVDQQDSPAVAAPHSEAAVPGSAAPQGRRSRSRRRPAAADSQDVDTAPNPATRVAHASLDLATEEQPAAAASGEVADVPTPSAIATRRRNPRVPQIAGSSSRSEASRREATSLDATTVDIPQSSDAQSEANPATRTDDRERVTPQTNEVHTNSQTSAGHARHAAVSTDLLQVAGTPAGTVASEDGASVISSTSLERSPVADQSSGTSDAGLNGVRDDVTDVDPRTETPLIPASSFEHDPRDVREITESTAPPVGDQGRAPSPDLKLAQKSVEMVAPPREAQRRRTTGWTPSVRPATVGLATTPREPSTHVVTSPQFTTRAQTLRELPSLIDEETELDVSRPAKTASQAPNALPGGVAHQIDVVSLGATPSGFAPPAPVQEIQTRRQPDRRGSGSGVDRYGRQRVDRAEQPVADPLASAPSHEGESASAPTPSGTTALPSARMVERAASLAVPATAATETPAIRFRPVVDQSPMRPPFVVDTDAAIYDVGGHTQLQHDDSGRGNSSGRRRGRDRFAPRSQAVVHHDPIRVSPSHSPEARATSPVVERINTTSAAPLSPQAPSQEPAGDLGLLLRGMDEIQQRQTERIISALRQNPVAPTTSRQTAHTEERVGVFVDVANMLYAARYLNRWIDFGRLLERLVADRRLVRAQAYSPTDPDPNAEQSFLAPVRGQGYRVTTKNYRTFSSGAKKADMDLDICMDIVRIVDARAVDCVVLCSGDGDFMPVIQYCYDHGVRVEIAAFAESTHDELKVFCDKFINLSMMDSTPSLR